MARRTTAEIFALTTVARLWPAANRFAAAIIGGYVFAYGFTALATFAGFGAGLPFSEAQALAWMLASLVYLGAILWGFASRGVAWAWTVLAGGGGAMSALALALSRWAA